MLQSSETVKFSARYRCSGKIVDDLDREIIRILKKDGRAGYISIGKKVGLSEGAVRKRIRNLTENGIIRSFTVMVSIAEGAEAIAFLSVNPSLPTQEVSKRIHEISNVETVYEVTGEYDIVAVIGGMNVVEVNECVEKIRRVEGIMKTNTMIVLRSW
jgi:DNA-binding Lrp family transcriptional regulator